MNPLWLLPLIPLALAWGLGRLPVRAVSEDERQDHEAAMREWREAA